MEPPKETPTSGSSEIRVVPTDPGIGNGWDVMRGDTFLSFHRTEEAANKQRDRLMRPLAGFGGWLVFFVVGLGVQIIGYGAEAVTTSNPVVIVFGIYLIVAALIAGAKLVRVHADAVRWTNIFLISSLVLFILNLIGGNYKVGLQGIFYVGLWFTYFKTSVRVQNTWPPRSAKPPIQKDTQALATPGSGDSSETSVGPTVGAPAVAAQSRTKISPLFKVIAAVTLALSVYVGLAEKLFSFLFPNQSIDQTVITQSVVNVLCSSAYGGQDSGGSGTIITTDGSVITNSHVIPQRTNELLTTEKGCLVILPKGQNGEPGEIYWANPVVIPEVSNNYDLAYLKIYGAYVDDKGEKHGTFPRTFPSIFSGEGKYDEVCRLNSNARLGDPVRIYGYPQTSGGFNLTVTDGIVSTVASEGVILTSAKVDAGNSGGLAVDTRGCMVGIPTAVTQGKYQNLGVITATSRVLEFSEAVDKWSQSR